MTSLTNSLKFNLKKYFNYSSFREGQEEIIIDIMKGKDVLGILPTGSGKSICYQLPARLLPGITIVISPLIALMIDQVKQLKANHFKEVIALNSFIVREKRRMIYQQMGKYKLIYVSPELLQQKEFRIELSKLHVSLFVIDEAHCISQWGYEFRPDYLRLGDIINELNDPTILALSATATSQIQKDISETLNRPNIIKHIYPIDRNNITLTVKHVDNNADKLTVINQILAKYRVPTLIYFSSRQIAEDIADELINRLPYRRIAFYHGGMDQTDRLMIQQQYMNDQLDIICCTSAFGMGINKDNIRLIIHYHFSPQIEAYIQEVGRAGRDGYASVSILLYAPNDEFLPEQIIQNELPSEVELKFAFQKLAELTTSKSVIPTDEVRLQEMFQVNETQWRFLYYQFEKHGIIKGNSILYDKKNWQSAYFEINLFRINRLALKQQKLTEMIRWIHEKGCLRHQLYRPFQQSFSEPLYQCCSNCGFSFTNWQPVQTEQSEITETTWDIKLQKLLLIGVQNETK